MAKSNDIVVRNINRMRFVAIFTSTFIIGEATYGQLKQKVGQILITDSLTQFEIKNDSLVEITLNRLWSKYSVKSDTLILTNGYDGGDFQGIFKIVKNTPDTLILFPIRFYKAKIYRMDTVRFISVRKRIIPIKDFQLLRINQYGTWGSKRLIVNKDKSVSFSNSGYYLPNEPATNVINFKLSDKKYKEFLDTLTQCLVFMISANKQIGDVYDPTYIDFTFQANGQSFVKKFIDFSPIHLNLYKYLIYDLTKQK